MNFNETLTVSAFLLVLFGVVSFYLYSRLTYVEKRMGLVENMLLDVKMAFDMTNKEETEFIPEPVGESAPLETEEAEHLPEESYYKNVLEQANTEEEEKEAPATAQQKVTPNYESMTKDELMTLCKDRQIETSKRPGRAVLIAALRKSDGTEPVTGASATSDLFPMAASASGEGAASMELESESLAPLV